MADSVFTKMLKGEIHREITYEDDVCFVIASNAPIQPGHSLVITKQQIADWLDLDEKTYLHLFGVVKKIGLIIKQAYQPPKVEVAIVGLEVPHVHIHVFPIYGLADIDFSNAKKASAEELKKEADVLRSQLKVQGDLK